MELGIAGQMEAILRWPDIQKKQKRDRVKGYLI